MPFQEVSNNDNQESQYQRKENMSYWYYGGVILVISSILLFISYTYCYDLYFWGQPFIYYCYCCLIPRSFSSESSVFLHYSHLQVLRHLTPLLQHSQYFFRQQDFLQQQARSAPSTSMLALKRYQFQFWLVQSMHLHSSLHLLPLQQHQYPEQNISSNFLNTLTSNNCSLGIILMVFYSYFWRTKLTRLFIVIRENCPFFGCRPFRGARMQRVSLYFGVGLDWG